MKLLIDMNLSPLWVPFLSASGVSAIHWSAVGSPSATDGEILEYAATNGLVILTHDLDFGMLLAALGRVRPSVLQVRAQDVLPSAIGAVVLRAIETARAQLEAGALGAVDPTQQRIRLLPI